MKPPYFVALFVVFSWLADIMLPEYGFEIDSKIGISFIILALLIFAYAVHLFRKNKTPIVPGTKPEFMITEGTYRFSRNPIYLAMAIFLIGACLLFKNYISFVFPIMFLLIMDKYYISYEEKLLGSIFGNKYTSYKKKVRRWI